MTTQLDTEKIHSEILTNISDLNVEFKTAIYGESHCEYIVFTINYVKNYDTSCYFNAYCVMKKYAEQHQQDVMSTKLGKNDIALCTDKLTHSFDIEKSFNQDLKLNNYKHGKLLLKNIERVLNKYRLFSAKIIFISQKFDDNHDDRKFDVCHVTINTREEVKPYLFGLLKHTVKIHHIKYTDQTFKLLKKN